MVADSPCKPIINESTSLKENIYISWDLTSQPKGNIKSGEETTFLLPNNIKDFYTLPTEDSSAITDFLVLDKEITTEYFISNLSKLTTAFNNELKKHADISEDLARSEFESIATLFAQLPFNKIALEITPSSLKLSMLFDNEGLLVVSKPFEPLEDVSPQEIIFSFFVKKELIASNVFEKTAFVQGFHKFLSM